MQEERIHVPARRGPMCHVPSLWRSGRLLKSIFPAIISERFAKSLVTGLEPGDESGRIRVNFVAFEIQGNFALRRVGSVAGMDQIHLAAAGIVAANRAGRGL